MVLITGASSGIGKACAKAFAQIGKNLFLVARRSERLAQIKQELEKQYSVEVHVAKLDVSQNAEVEKFAKTYTAQLERVEILVNNAGLAKGRDLIQDGKIADWDVMWDTNVKGLLYVTHAILPFFLKHNRGHIVNLGSVAGRWAYPKGNVYAATKSAVSSLTESLRLDLLGKRIRVSEIAPGMVETEFSLVRFNDEKLAKAVYEGMEPLTADDIADAVVWVSGRPPRVNIQQVVIYPVAQASTNHVSRNTV